MVITEGPVNPKSRLFVGRAEELRTLHAWLGNTACVGAVMGARQTGKTSLLLKLRHVLRRKYAFAFVDLQAVEGADVRECFRYIAAEARAQLAADLAADVPLPGNSHEFLGFLRELSNGTTAIRSILILDEIGALPPETALKLASTIRALFTSRLVRPEYAKYVVLLAGATDMLELTTGRNSPLRNVTESIYLGDLTLPETEQLLGNVLGRARMRMSPDIIRHLHSWTGGHPYWTQLLAGALQRPSGDLTEARLSSIVEKLLPTEDKNLPHVFRSLKDDQTLWNVIELLLDGSSLAFSRANPSIARLELIGLVKNRDGRCAIRNKIYHEVLQQQQTKPKRFSPRDLRRLSQLLAQARQLDSLLRLAADELRLLLQCRSVALFRLSSDRLSYSLVASAGVRQTTAKFMAQGRLAPLLDAAFDPTTVDLTEDELRQLRELDCAAVVPMREKDLPVGFVTLAPKLSTLDYDQHDLEFVGAVCEQIVACMERLHLREIERDAERARLMQEELLPKSIPQIDGVQVAARWQPARIVSGDYYDVLKLGDNTLAVTIGDVVGKGMSAALMMSNLQAAVRTRASEAMAPHILCHELNQLMAGNVAIGKFITFFYGLLDGRTHRFTYTNAGHTPPILIRVTGEIQHLHVGGGVLAVSREWGYEQDFVDLRPGDRILMFTDGATDVWNSDGHELGEEGLIELFAKYGHLAAEEVQDKMLESISAFAGGNFADDVTLVVINLPL